MRLFYAGDFDPQLIGLLGSLLRARGQAFSAGVLSSTVMPTVDVIIVDGLHPRAEHIIGTFHRANYAVVAVNDIGPNLGAEDAAVRAWHQAGADFCLRRLYDEEGLGELIDDMLETLQTGDVPVFAGMAID